MSLPQVTVNIQDENDNAPAFSSSLYAAEVMEASDPGLAVLRVFVSDPDPDFTSRVSFRMELSTMLLIIVAESMWMVELFSVSGEESREEVALLGARRSWAEVSPSRSAPIDANYIWAIAHCHGNKR